MVLVAVAVVKRQRHIDLRAGQRKVFVAVAVDLVRIASEPFKIKPFLDAVDPVVTPYAAAGLEVLPEFSVGAINGRNPEPRFFPG